MAKRLNGRLLNVVTVLFLISLVVPLLPPASAQDAATPTTVQTITTDSVVTIEEPEIVGPTAPPADTTPPVVTVPDTISVTADESGFADVQFGDQIWAVDDVDGPVAVSAEPQPGAFPVGDTTVMVTASDAAGNVGTATFMISVSPAPVPTDPPPPTAEPTVAMTESVAEPTAAPDISSEEVSNVSPVAVDDAYTVLHRNSLNGRDLKLDVMANDYDPDGDSIRVNSVTQPSNGAVDIIDPSNGVIRYYAWSGFVGIDSFTYTITDPSFKSSTATVTITVTNTPPEASDDSATMLHYGGGLNGRSIDLFLFDNDSDADGDKLVIANGLANISEPANGSISLEDASIGHVVYTPNSSFTGTDSFTYNVTDGTATDTATVTITVTDTAPIDQHQVNVIVTDFDSGIPIEGASVVILNPVDSEFQITGTTDASGIFSSEVPESAEYRVDASAGGYFTETTFVTVSGSTDIALSLHRTEDGVLTVQVTETDGVTAIEGATIAAYRVDDASLVAEGVTDADGLFVTNGAIPSTEYNIQVTKDGYQTDFGHRIKVIGPTTHNVALEPVPVYQLSVIVTDIDTGNAIGGATVAVRDYYTWEIVASGLTGADGTFTTGSLPGGEYYVEATAADYFDYGTWALVDSNAATTVTLEPRIAGTLTTTVLDQTTDGPVASATVTVSYWDEETYETIIVATGITGTDGTFTTPSLEGRDYSVQARADGYYDGGTGIRVNGDTNTTFTLEPRVAGTLTVEVLDQATDLPVAGASVTVHEYGNGETISSGVTGTTGTFTTASLAGADYYVEVRADNYYGDWSYPRVNGNTTTTVRLEPRVAGTLTVTVLDQDTELPISDAAVTVSYWDEITYETIIVATGSSSQDGTFTTTSLEGRDYYIEATAEGYYVGNISARVEGDTTTTVTLEPRITGVLTVEVLDQASNDPVEGASIVVRNSSDWSEVATGTSNAGGTFVTGSLPGGDYEIVITADGYYSTSAWVRVSGDTTRTITLESRVAGTLTVSAIEMDSDPAIPVDAATITVRDNQSGEVVATGMTGAGGTFTTDALAGGDYYVEATADGYYGASNGVRVSGDTDLTLPLEPKVAGTLTVTVHEMDSDPVIPIAGATVNVRDTETSEVVATGTTTPDGTFTTEILGGGYYYVDISKTNYYPSSYNWIRVNGDTVETLTLEPRVPGVLTVEVHDQVTNGLVAAADVTVRDNSTNEIVAEGTTGPEGAFSTSELTGGDYYVEVRANGYFGNYMWVRVNGPTDVTVGLEPRIAGILTVDVRNDSTDAPIPNAAITVRDDSWNVVATGTTNNDGTFATAELLPGGDYGIEVSIEGYYTGGSYSQRVSGDATLSIRLEPRISGTLTVHVEDQISGMGVANARIEITSWDLRTGLIATTDANGMFTTSTLEGGEYSINVIADEYFTGYDSLKLNGDAETAILLQPREQGSLTFRVTDATSGEPIGGATIAVRSYYDPMAGEAVGTTGADGIYTTGPLPGADYYITVTANGYFDAYDGRLLSGDEEVKIQLTPKVEGRATVSVTNVDTGEPIANAEVIITDYAGSQTVFGQTGSDGTFVSQAVLEGGYHEVRVSAEGFASLSRDIHVEGDTSVELALRPSAEGKLTIVVYGNSSNERVTVEGASITVTHRDTGETITGITGATGQFTTTSDIPNGYYVIDVEADGYYAGGGLAYVASDTAEEVYLQARIPGFLSLTVTSPITFDPIEGATVTIWSGSPDDAPISTGRTNVDGIFESGMLPAEDIWFKVEAEGYFDNTLYSLRLYQEVTHREVILTPLNNERIATVTVVDAVTGEPIEDATISLSNCGRYCDLAYRGFTDATGQLVSSQLPAGRYWVTVSAEGYVFSDWPRPVELHLLSGDASITIALMPTDGNVSVNIQPDVDGAYVLTSPGGTSTLGSISDGTASLGLHPYGPGYSVTIYGNGFGPVTLSFSISSSDVQLQLELTETASAASLSLSTSEGEAGSHINVSGAGFVPGEDVALRWNSPSGALVDTVTATTSGGFSNDVTIPSAAPGTHTILAVGLTSGRTANSSFTVTAPPATLTISPTSGPVGTSVSVSGSGYVSGEWIAVRWDGGVSLVWLQAKSSGAISGTLTIPATATLGDHTLVTTSPSGRGTTVPFTVTSIGTRTDPVSMGGTTTIGDYTVTVVSATTDATDIVLAENQFNDPPAAGYQFFMARVSVTYLGDSTGDPYLDLDIQAVGEKNVAYTTYENSCGVIPDPDYGAPELFPGGTIEFNVCWEINSADEDSLVMFVEEFLVYDSDIVWLSLRP